MRKINWKYKTGIYLVNPGNPFRIKDMDDGEELLQTAFDNVKRESNKFSKFQGICYNLDMSFGLAITRECFLDILDYVEFSYEDFLDYREKYKETGFLKYQLKWFDHLDDKYFDGGKTYNEF